MPLFSRGQADAERLVEEHYADVVRYCRRHAPSGFAEDAAQEAFLRFVRASGGYRERGQAGAYLIAIARNVCIDMLRAQAKGWDELPETVSDGRDEPGENDDEHDVARALASLPRAQREAVELRYGQGLGVAEVARVMGISRFSASRTISAGLEALRGQLQHARGGLGKEGVDETK